VKNIRFQDPSLTPCLGNLQGFCPSIRTTKHGFTTSAVVGGSMDIDVDWPLRHAPAISENTVDGPSETSICNGWVGRPQSRNLMWSRKRGLVRRGLMRYSSRFQWKGCGARNRVCCKLIESSIVALKPLLTRGVRQRRSVMEHSSKIFSISSGVRKTSEQALSNLRAMKSRCLMWTSCLNA
jgi:hypothetical protein